MAHKIIIPKFDANIEEGTIVRWLKKEGSKVKKGEPLLEFETFKAVMDVKSEFDGILAKIIVPGREEAKVLEQVGTIIEEGENPANIEEDEQKEDRIKISPRARMLAKENNIDISCIKGTGPQGRIIEKDLNAEIKDGKNRSGKKRREDVKTIPIPKVKKIAMERLRRSLREKPHSSIAVSVDMKNLLEKKDKITDDLKMMITPNDIIIKELAGILAKFGLFNSDSDDSNIIMYKDINIGVAVNTKEGLFVPVIKKADKKSLADISKESKGLLRKAISNRLSIDDLAGSTFTCTNLAEKEVAYFKPIINQGQNSILGIGSIIEKPVAVGEDIKIRPVCSLILSFNHGVINGAEAAEFLSELKKKLES